MPSKEKPTKKKYKNPKHKLLLDLDDGEINIMQPSSKGVTLVDQIKKAVGNK